MIEIKCTTQDTIMLNQLVPFQGDLKKRTVKDIKELSHSLLNDGLLMPFVIWDNNDKCCILDGHGRLAALTDLAMNDPSISEQAFPCIYISADTEEEAKKALLQITSQYGKISKPGIEKFVSNLGDYKAPVINKFIRKPMKRRNLEETKGNIILSISIPSDRYLQFKAIIDNVEYAKILK